MRHDGDDTGSTLSATGDGSCVHIRGAASRCAGACRVGGGRHAHTRRLQQDGKWKSQKTKCMNAKTRNCKFWQFSRRFPVQHSWAAAFPASSMAARHVDLLVRWGAFKLTDSPPRF